MSSKRFAPVWKIMKAPGQGLLTVSTGAEKIRERINKKIPLSKQKNWAKHVKQSIENNTGPSLIGFPSDSGGGICRGTAHGPLWLRPLLYSNGWAKNDLGDIPCIPQLSDDALLSAGQKKLCSKALWGKIYKSNYPISPLNLLSEFLSTGYKAQRSNFQPLVIGGDHSLSWPCIKALKQNNLAKDCAILHLDAHTDLMESRFGIDHCFATWASHASKALKNPAQLLQLAIRQSTKTKKHWENSFGIKQLWMKDLEGKSSSQLSKKISHHFQSLGCKNLYISIDIDALDSKIAPSTGTPEKNGLSLALACSIISKVSKDFHVLGADLVEVAPVLGSPKNASKTLKAAQKLVQAIHW